MKHSNSSDENRCISKDIQKVLKYFSSSSEEEHMENALALGADEGRDKLQISYEPQISECGNTHDEES